jgi:hypothetical protein
MDRSKAQITGDLGELAVERALISLGWTPNRLHRDEGIDYFVHGVPYLRPEANSLSPEERKEMGTMLTVRPLFLAQVKTLGPDSSKHGTLRLQVDDLLDWSTTPLPVLIFVVEEASNGIVVIDARALVATYNSTLGPAWKKQATKSVDLPRFGPLANKRWKHIERLIRKYCDILDGALKGMAPPRSVDDLSRVYYHPNSPRHPLPSSRIFSQRLEEAFPQASDRSWVSLFLMTRPAWTDVTSNIVEVIRELRRTV